MSRPPKAFAKDVSREELIAYVRRLEAELAALDEEQDALDTALAQLRSCTDPRCTLCRQCVTQLFVRTKPLAMTLPKKYVEAPWRR